VGLRALDAPSADREADPIAEQLTRRTRASRHDSRARRYALSTVRPSPARAAAPEPETWLSITDLGELLDLEVQLWADELDVAPAHAAGAAGAETVVSTPAAPTGNVTLLPSPAAPEVPAPPTRRAVPEPARQAPLVEPARRPAPPGAVARARSLTRPSAPARPSLVQAVVLTATAAAVAVGALIATGPKQHEVTIELDGRTAARTTDARTVGELLREQRVVLGPLDRVVPSTITHLDDGLVVRIERDAAVAHAGTAVVAPVALEPASPAPAPPATAPPAPAAVGTGASPVSTPPSTPSPAAKSPVIARRSPPVAVRLVNGSADGGASWYASPFGSDSCASRTLKMGTIVTIRNTHTGATATCRVADRGPVARSWVLDLDNEVFRRLAPLAIGVIPVRITW
jgi:G5-linked-Ubiquitin-like domain